VTETDRKLWGYYSEGRRDMCTDYYIAYARCMRDLTEGKGVWRGAAAIYFANLFQCKDESHAQHLCELAKHKAFIQRNMAEIEDLRKR